ncbi:hypothetical protein J4727_15250 [Providencia rettgeri]|uniref:Uncharacterized protein n=1 Tax=Providencia rettgeri TaxID=587 RepID=A0A939NFX7_PRORE|nr:hypothetical protein [Providencia rettgeri]
MIITGVGLKGGGWSSNYDQKTSLWRMKILLLLKTERRKCLSLWIGAFRLEVVNPENQLVSSVQFWAGYSWQDNTGEVAQFVLTK